jgi:hypothetical protein
MEEALKNKPEKCARFIINGTEGQTCRNNYANKSGVYLEGKFIEGSKFTLRKTGLTVVRQDEIKK